MILVTGGAGYIGSHTVVELLRICVRLTVNGLLLCYAILIWLARRAQLGRNDGRHLVLAVSEPEGV